LELATYGRYIFSNGKVIFRFKHKAGYTRFFKYIQVITVGLDSVDRGTVITIKVNLVNARPCIGRSSRGKYISVGIHKGSKEHARRGSRGVGYPDTGFPIRDIFPLGAGRGRGGGAIKQRGGSPVPNDRPSGTVNYPQVIKDSSKAGQGKGRQARSNGRKVNTIGGLINGYIVGNY
jgi:hypothetical protein